MTPAQIKLASALDSGWLEHKMSGTYEYRSPGFRAKSLNEKTVLAVMKEVPLVRIYCKTPIKGIPCLILIKEDKIHLLDGHYIIIRKQ